MGGGLSGVVIAVLVLAGLGLVQQSLARARFSRRVDHVVARSASAGSGADLADVRGEGTDHADTDLAAPAESAGDPMDAENLSELCCEVAARLRSGAPPDRAWRQAWMRMRTDAFAGADDDGVPLVFFQWRTLPAGLAARVWDRLRPGHANRTTTRAAADSLVMACRFSGSAGVPLAEVLAQVAGGLSQSVAISHAQQQAFTGPQLSARILTALPAVAVLVAHLLGISSAAWFFGSAQGLLSGAVGAGCLLAGHLTSRRLIARARTGAADSMQAAAVADLVEAAVRVGQSVPAVLSAVGSAREDAAYTRVSRELVMGVPWQAAWDPPPVGSELIRAALQASWEDGVSPTTLLAHLSAGRRANHLAEAEKRAAALSVQLVIPLGLFLLPAFIFLGVLPVVVGLLGGL